ncbi:hypothetical protein ACFYZ8_20115 [Streptomyces sp. NPDC001668]|uniref:hypothetical protein n=1 Tax=unclassified Streptomyces TaxID=2593676 RepID=UPI0036CF19C0
MPIATWPARERAFLIFFGTPGLPGGWRDQLPADAGAAPVLTLEEPLPGYATFGALDRALEKVLPVARREAPELVAQYARTLVLFTDPAERTALGRLVPLAESAALGTTRRISRESHDSAKIIDAVARFLALLPGRTAAFRRGLVLVVPGLDAWDRPSLRVLYRASLLARPEAPLTVVGLCPPRLTRETGQPTTLRQRMDALRRRFLSGLAERDGVHTVDLDTPHAPSFPHDLVDVTHALPGPGTATDRGDALLRAMGEALSFQNFERVLLISESSRRLVDGELAVQLDRLSAIADAQSGDLETAKARLTAAQNSSRDPIAVAHLHYLIGLLLTKRAYDLDAAMRQYAKGRAVISDLYENTPQARVEYAWLLNGEALISAMRARSAGHPEERDALHEEAFRKAFQAFRLVRGTSGLSAFYLRHNLAANLTFLLEITSRVKEARTFWERAMESPSENEKKAFTLPYRMRTGLLLHKEGDTDGALVALEEALEVAREIEDPFYEERVLAALGHVAATTGHLERAAAAYTDGLAVAAHLRDVGAQEVHAAGLLWVAARADLGIDGSWIHSVHAWPTTARERLAGALADGSLAAVLDELGLRPQVPGPKLPPYIPGVDLEGAPKKDINRLLVGADAEPAPGTAMVGAGGTA